MQLIRIKQAPVTSMPGGVTFVAVRKLVLLGFGLSVGYGFLATASKGFCPDSGPILDDGSHQCVQVSMRPLPLIFIAIVALIYSAISRISTRVSTIENALLVVENRARAMTLLVVVSLVVGHLWFWLVPESIDYSQSWGVVYPFPFVLAEVTTSFSPAP